MAGSGTRQHDEAMTDTVLRGRAAALLSIRTFAVAGALALALSGCSASTPSVDDIVPDEASAGDTGGATDESSDDSGDGEVTVIGAELVSSFAAIAAETYAEGRDPMPSVEFTAADAVTFTFPGELDEAARIGNCQIAYGVLDAEGIAITIVDNSGSLDCTALVEG